MRIIVAYLATGVNSAVAFYANDTTVGAKYPSGMGRPASIHKGKTPRGIIFIREWADKYELTPADFIEALGVDKSTVSRWFDGQLPSEANLPRIAAYLHCDVADLFRLPGDDWMRRFFQNRAADEIEHIKRSMEAVFPMKASGKGAK